MSVNVNRYSFTPCSTLYTCRHSARVLDILPPCAVCAVLDILPPCAVCAVLEFFHLVQFAQYSSLAELSTLAQASQACCKNESLFVAQLGYSTVQTATLDTKKIEEVGNYNWKFILFLINFKSVSW